MPIYKKIIDYIEECIRTGTYMKGSLLPTEQEFCNMFNTSRMTVRKAFDELAIRGLIYRIKGKGSFVSHIESKRDYTLMGFSQIMREKGIDFKTKVISKDIIKASKDVAEKLRILEGDPVYFLERIRYIYDEAVTVEKIYLNSKLYQDFLSFDFSKVSLYETLEKHYGTKLLKVDQKISTIDITGKDAKILFNKKSGTALMVNGLSYSNNAVPVEYEIGLYNGYKYAVDVLIQ